MTTYRVDRVMDRRVPCGMNSIVYVGRSEREARRAFAKTQPGRDAWNQPNGAYGVILSVWNGKDYVIKDAKGLS